VLAIVLSLPGAALALPGEGYATGPGSTIWKTPYGACVRTGTWSAGEATAECDPELVRKPVAALAPPVARPEPVPAPIATPTPAVTPAPIVTPAPPPIARAAPALKPKPTVTLGAAELFGFNQASLTAAGRTKLDKEVVDRAKKEYAELRSVNINGHTDRLGSSPYNQKLSERRADAVRTYLVSRGMDGSKIQSHGYGKTSPVKACPAQKDRKALIACLGPNRRVEIEISGTRS
jgi:OOP family OmpA-OmpF porin